MHGAHHRKPFLACAEDEEEEQASHWRQKQRLQTFWKKTKNRMHTHLCRSIYIVVAVLVVVVLVVVVSG